MLYRSNPPKIQDVADCKCLDSEGGTLANLELFSGLDSQYPGLTRNVVGRIKRTILEAGFSLLEVLVAIVLITGSGLGLAGLQKLGAQYAHRAYLKTQGMIQINDIAERMRANPAGVTSGVYNTSPLPNSYEKNCGARGVACSDAELAKFDLVSWNADNARVLPDGSGTITRESPESAGVFRIRVEWVQQVDQISSISGYVNQCDGGLKPELHCVQISVRL